MSVATRQESRASEQSWTNGSRRESPSENSLDSSDMPARSCETPKRGFDRLSRNLAATCMAIRCASAGVPRAKLVFKS